MQNLSFFNSIINSFKDKYDQMATRFMPTNVQPKISTGLSSDNATTEVDKPISDQYLPSSSIVAPPDESEMTKVIPDTYLDGNGEEADDNGLYTPEQQVPSGEVDSEKSFYINRASSLKYGMDLRFDMSTLTSAIESIENGETTSLQEFATANFGFSADMFFKGHSTVDTNIPSDNPNHLAMAQSRIGNAQASKFAANAQDFAVSSFQKEAGMVSKKSMTINNRTHSLAINKFTARFKMDSGFGFANLNRFNVQSNRMAEEAPDSLNNYFETAGNVAESGTTEMMATFFDGVDAYLNSAETTLIAKAEEFFDMAAEQLGFSEGLVDMAKDQMVGTIENFFNNVDDAINSLRELHNVPVASTVIEVAEPEVIDIVDPTNDIILDTLEQLEKNQEVADKTELENSFA